MAQDTGSEIQDRGEEEESKMSEPTKRDVLKACHAVSVIDDKLGGSSDHEGDENGPTWYRWTLGKAQAELLYAQSVRLHKEAIVSLTHLRKLNSRRKP